MNTSFGEHLAPGDWAWSVEHQQVCRVVETQHLWGETLYRVWVPAKDAVVRVRESQLEPAAETALRGSAWVSYVTAAARVCDALTQDVLLAPIGASVIPLPHQIRALSRAVSDDRVRYLLADAVGLGKTIEAGLIMRELKLRGRVRRTLVVAPRGLVTQGWPRCAPTSTRSSGLHPERLLCVPVTQEDNVWRRTLRSCAMDSVKPLDGRRGWSRDRVAEYNRDRFEDLTSGRVGPDHRRRGPPLGWKDGSGRPLQDSVRSGRVPDGLGQAFGRTPRLVSRPGGRVQPRSLRGPDLGRGLAEAAPYLLLLSATPHQGKTDAFHRLISLVDEDAFPDSGSISKERVQPFVIRTEKRHAIDAEGRPLFKPRSTRLVPIVWEERHGPQRSLYEAVTEYVREGYNQAVREKKNYIGFLMILMQRLVTSSTRAIHDGRAPCTGRIVEANRVVGCVRGDARDVVVDGLDQLDARRRVIDRRVRERVSDDHTGVINTHMEFLPPARATASMFRSGPFTLAGNRQASAVDDEMKACAPWNAPKP